MTDDAFTAPQSTPSTPVKLPNGGWVTGLGATLILGSFLVLLVLMGIVTQTVDIDTVDPDALLANPWVLVTKTLSISSLIAGIWALAIGTRNVWFGLVCLAFTVYVVGGSVQLFAPISDAKNLLFIGVLLLLWRVFHAVEQRALSLCAMAGATLLIALVGMFWVWPVPTNQADWDRLLTLVPLLKISSTALMWIGLVGAAFLGFRGRLHAPPDAEL